MTPREAKPGLVQPAIVLVEPSLAENIGSVARAMLNFGLTDLRIVSPKLDWPSDRAKATASGADSVLETARICRSLTEAIGDLQLVYATSARPRDLVKQVMTPRAAAAEIRAEAQTGTRIGVLFGTERSGLLNDDVALATSVITVPLNPEFSSINLAQAVLLVAYEWFQAGEVDVPPVELRHGEARLAEEAEVLAFMARLEAELDDCGFLRVPHMRGAMVRNLRAIFGRVRLTLQEVRTLHGVVTELVTKRVGRV